MAIKSLIKDESRLNNFCYIVVELVTALQVACIIPLLLLPRLGLWSRDKAAKGIADEATEVAVGRIDAIATEVEAVGVVGTRIGPRRPAAAVLVSDVKLISAVGNDTPTPHKEQRTKSYIIRITIN